ncbi:MAG: phosphoribosylformylglycinamidine synthase subunit PurQ [Actinomycetaceae bacterium]|nr:phosphoribosylformylglycinamidine synthase subunit PurQ [Actinomycetaceae bacterium]
MSRIAVVTFPGTLDDQDAARAVRLAGGTPVSLWHKDHSLKDADAVILPGGFSYGDYLRCGAIARFAPVMDEVVAAAKAGMPVLGICNGFQVLCEAHLLPGALVCNHHQKFICRDQELEVVNTDTAWTGKYQQGQRITVPLKNGEGCFVADAETVRQLEDEGRVVFRYRGLNPNGSVNDIAGICNEGGNVVGLMPHPEHAVEDGFGPQSRERSHAGVDGLGMFTSVLEFLMGTA